MRRYITRNLGTYEITAISYGRTRNCSATGSDLIEELLWDR